MRKQISFSQIVGRGLECHIEGEGLQMLPHSLRQRLMGKLPMSFLKVNHIVKLALDPIEYIDFWGKVKIYI